jgi:glutathione synthase
MELLFVADPLESFKPHKDSTVAMMREAGRRGHRLFATEPRWLRWHQNGLVGTIAREIEVHDSNEAWFTVVQDNYPMAVVEPTAVVMRKDPPFDSEYFYATHLLGQAEREGARVFNSPAALRNHPEKLAIMEFPKWIAPTVVTRDPAVVRRFHDEHKDIILKPLDGMGGMGIFRVGPDAMNLGSMIETLNGHDQSTTFMAQKYLPAIKEGDKRVLLINGEPVPFALARIPQGTEIRGNMAVGGKGVAQPLSARDLEIAKHLGPILAARGLLLVGLDIIGDSVTEINVTSPTGFQEITQQTGFDVAKMFMDALEKAAA